MRNALGASLIHKALPGTIRGDLKSLNPPTYEYYKIDQQTGEKNTFTQSPANILHGSDSIDSADREYDIAVKYGLFSNPF